MTIRSTILASACVMSLLVGCSGAPDGSGGDGDPASTTAKVADPKLNKHDHIFVVMMENTGYDSLIGNAHAPWINAAAKTYGVATDYFGVAHPSQPNYVAATAGQTGPLTDADETLDVPNLVDQLESNGRTWKAYMQGLSLCGGDKLAHACGNQLYERKHDPFVTFADVQSDATRMANVVDLDQLSADLAADAVPDFVWISPDQCHDMHGRGGPASDACSFAHNGPIANADLIAVGDAFLSDTVGAITASSAWTPKSLVFVVWDESDFTGSGPEGFGDTSGCCGANPGGGHVLGLVISREDHKPRTSDVAYNHYSMLATVEQAWGLGCLGATCDASAVAPMIDLASPSR